MPAFRYQATDDVGGSHAGTVEAESLRAAVAALKARGYTVRRLESVRDAIDATIKIEVVEEPAAVGRVSEATAAETAGLLAEAVAAGLPLEPALRAAAAEAPRSERAALVRIADALAAGVPPDEAFDAAGDALPPHLLALVQAGLRSGRLGPMLGRYLLLARQRADMTRPLILALLYPCVLVVGAATLNVLALVWIVPQFDEMYSSFGKRLPAITEAVLWLSRTLRSPAGWIALGIAALLAATAIAAWIIVRRRAGRAGLPLFDLLLRAGDWGRFCGLLALLVDARIALPQALRLTGVAAATGRVRRAGLGLAEDVEEGLTLWEAARSRPVPPPIRQAFRWADRPELLSEALGGLAELYSRRTRLSAGIVALFVEPFALVFVAVGIGMTVLSLLAPMIQLLNDLS